MINFLVGIAIALLLVFVGARTVAVRTKNLDNPFVNPFSATVSSTNTSSLPVLADRMPEFEGIAGWINSTPLTPAKLNGKVVLIDFWTYSCINCIRTLPYLNAWQEKYGDKGFTIIGVHTPEFAFEKSEANVRQAVQRDGITYPVALDSDYGTWNAYANHYWPAHYLFDAEGRLRSTKYGEGGYEETEREIQSLLKEAGADADMPTTSASSTTVFSKIASPESYLGSRVTSCIRAPMPSNPPSSAFSGK